MFSRSSSYILLCIMIYTGGVWTRNLKHDNQYNNDNNTKISNGVYAKIENYPYNALLILNNGNKISYCGGSIISTKSILTSAGCLEGIKKIKVRIGSTYSNTEACPACPVFEYFASSFSIHPRYNNRTHDYNIGVVNINKGMNLDGERASAIRLPATSNDATVGEVVTITGWGATKEDGTERNIVLQMGKASVITRQECRTRLHGISRRMFCATGEANICKGDFGGPARGQQRVLTGIASHSPNCDEKGMPGVYVRVGESMIRSFIRIQTGM